MEEKFFTTDQVAKKLQVHPFTILKYIKSGKLRGIKLGRVYRIKESDMNKFIEERMTQKKKEKESPSTRYETTIKQESQGENDESHYYII